MAGNFWIPGDIGCWPCVCGVRQFPQKHICVAMTAMRFAKHAIYRETRDT